MVNFEFYPYVSHLRNLYSRFVCLQTALIGMDIPMYDNRRIISEYDIFNGGIGYTDEFPFDDDYIEVCSFKCIIYGI